MNPSERNNWAAKLAAAALAGSEQQSVAALKEDISATVTALRAAAGYYAASRSGFAQGKDVVCLDIANRVEQYGGFASDKQRDFALKLIEWSQPRTAASPAAGFAVPKLFAVMQKHAKFYAGPLKLSRRNADTLVWILWNDVAVGKIENARVMLFPRKFPEAHGMAATTTLLNEFEANPLEAAKKYGRESGICCSCGADLTNEDSIAAGIGPICAGKF